MKIKQHSFWSFLLNLISHNICTDIHKSLTQKHHYFLDFTVNYFQAWLIIKLKCKMHDISRMNNHFSSECECLHRMVDGALCWLPMYSNRHHKSRSESTALHYCPHTWRWKLRNQVEKWMTSMFSLRVWPWPWRWVCHRAVWPWPSSMSSLILSHSHSLF